MSKKLGNVDARLALVVDHAQRAVAPGVREKLRQVGAEYEALVGFRGRKRVEWAEEVKRLQAEWRERMLLEEAERNAGLDEVLRGLWRAGVPKRWLYTVCNGNRPRVDAALEGEDVE